jgi:low molecular weight protein-tyrosine phosphatase
MTAILVVCAGNVCRSPIAEGLLRVALEARLAAEAPSVASAGTMGWVGSGADPSSVVAAAELGIDISGHRAREVSDEDVARSILILAMAPEHARAFDGEARERTFTLKELVRLLEALPERASGQGLAGRIAAADGPRGQGFAGDPRDEGIMDPLGMPLDAFRAVATELDGWCSRLTVGLFGHAEATATTGTSRS